MSKYEKLANILCGKLLYNLYKSKNKWNAIDTLLIIIYNVVAWFFANELGGVDHEKNISTKHT
jgi:hypothetical protein